MEKGPVSTTSSGPDVHMEGGDTERRDGRADRSRRDKQDMNGVRKPSDHDGEPGSSGRRGKSKSSSSSNSSKKFFCPCCNIGHASSEELINHIKEFPIKLETFSCDVCMLEFFNKSDLLDHQRVDHQKAARKKFRCDECGLGYTFLGQLTRHKKMHEDIAKKLAASGIILPKQKAPESPAPPPPKGRTSDDVSPELSDGHSAPDSPDSSSFADPPKKPEKPSQVTEQCEKKKPSPRIDQIEETEDKAKGDSREDGESAEETVSVSARMTRKQSAKASRSNKKDATHFFIKVESDEEDKKAVVSNNDDDDDDDERQNDIDNSSDVAFDEEDTEEDSDYYEVKKRGRGRPKLTNKAKKRKTSVTSKSRRSAKRARTRGEKKSASKKPPEDKNPTKATKAPEDKNPTKDKKAPEDKNPTKDKKAPEDKEETEVPAHLKNEDGTLRCPECDMKCFSMRGLTEHRRHHFRTMEQLPCVLCGERFADKTSMNSHMGSRHNVWARKTRGKTSDDKQEFPCTEGTCRKVLRSQKALTRHRLSDHGVDPATLYTCQQCGKVLANSHQLSQHKKMHGDNRPYICSICSKAYKSSGGLLWHLNTHSETQGILSKYPDISVTEKGRYSCGECGKELRSLYGIRKHKENPEAKCSATPGYYGKWKPKRTICEVCGVELSSMQILKNHMVLHTNEKPHKCRFCEASFRFYKTKNLHEKTHKSEKDFVCTMCGEAFYDNHHLKKHMNAHKDEKEFACNLCGKLFFLDTYRRKHEKRCRNFMRCPICAAVFRQRERLRRHMSINHHGVDVDYWMSQPLRHPKVVEPPVMHQPLSQQPPPPPPPQLSQFPPPPSLPLPAPPSPPPVLPPPSSLPVPPLSSLSVPPPPPALPVPTLSSLHPQQLPPPPPPPSQHVDVGGRHGHPMFVDSFPLFVDPHQSLQ